MIFGMVSIAHFSLKRLQQAQFNDQAWSVELIITKMEPNIIILLILKITMVLSLLLKH